MKKYSVSIVGKQVTEKTYNMDSEGRKLALIAVETAMLLGFSVCIDVVEIGDNGGSEYIKDYVSL